jgi:hypothetical protein
MSPSAIDHSSKHWMHQLNSSVHPEPRVGATPQNAIEHVSDFDLGAIKPKLIRPPFLFILKDRLPSKPGMGAGTFIPEPTPIFSIPTHHPLLPLEAAQHTDIQGALPLQERRKGKLNQRGPWLRQLRQLISSV